MQVQRHLQLRIEAQGKYMQSILEKACQTLASGETVTPANFKGTIGNQAVPDVGTMKDFCPPLSFPPFQDLNLYGGDQIDHLQQNMDRQSSLDHGFMQNNDNICLGKKRTSPYNGGSGTGKSPLMWSDDLRLQDLGTAPCIGPQDDPFKGDQIQIAPPSTDLDSISDIYETKPVLSGDAVSSEKKFEASSAKLERPSPRRTPISAERMNPAMMNTGGMQQGRNSPYG